MANEYYSQNKIAQIFQQNISKTAFFNAEQEGLIPRGKRFRLGAINHRGWDVSSLPKMGELWGFLKKFNRPMAISVFTTKGGVLKTTLALNIARMCALHNIRTCVVGLDMQGDVTSALGHNADLENCEDLQVVLDCINKTKGLADIFNRTTRLEDVILPTELPTLFYIPETPELAALNESLSNINRREYWLREKVADPLLKQFDLVIYDCAPNWNRLITNALVACDVLLSPLECKINNFRNFKVFRHFLGEFKKDMGLHFETIFIPTKYSKNKKLTMEIKAWYLQNISGCTTVGISESVSGEEATAMRQSLPEHAPTKAVADEFRTLLMQIQERANKSSERPKTLPTFAQNTANTTGNKTLNSPLSF